MPPTKKELFLELAKPNKEGFSREVKVSEFTDKYSDLRLGNGGSWCRDDSSLAKDYDIHRIKTGNKITSIRLTPKKSLHYSNQIKASIKKSIIKKACVVLGTKSKFVECDHKVGFKMLDVPIEEQTEDLFQPLHKSVNVAKRSHCKKCKTTRKRFDARKLGYKNPVFIGNLNYIDTCKGCYWHDPFRFNREISI